MFKQEHDLIVYYSKYFQWGTKKTFLNDVGHQAMPKTSLLKYKMISVMSVEKIYLIYFYLKVLGP